MTNKTPAARAAYRLAHPDHGGANRGQGNKQRILKFRNPGNTPITPQQRARMNALWQKIETKELE